MSFSNQYAAMAQVVMPFEIARTVADPDDDVVLGTALAGHAGYVVTGDQHLLSLTEFRGVQIVSASEVERRLS